ncbi:hypothetical protein [uncultured Gammaproteobacteria bacterium]|nr:hypothetical protein [uncultured Gammaproteobacteria bacterium]
MGFCCVYCHGKLSLYNKIAKIIPFYHFETVEFKEFFSYFSHQTPLFPIFFHISPIKPRYLPIFYQFPLKSTKNKQHPSLKNHTLHLKSPFF